MLLLVVINIHMKISILCSRSICRICRTYTAFANFLCSDIMKYGCRGEWCKYQTFSAICHGRRFCMVFFSIMLYKFTEYVWHLLLCMLLCAATFKKGKNVLAPSAVVFYFWNKIHLFSKLLYLEVIFLRI